MGAKKSARGGHEHDHRTDENLLHLIADKERALEAQLTAAKADAASLVAQARAEAEKIQNKARDTAAAAAREQEQRVAAEVARIQNELTSRGTREVETLRRQAAQAQAQAVQLVVDRIVKGTSA
jgi:vacuolar-type H+-ATPase subunit H